MEFLDMEMPRLRDRLKQLEQEHAALSTYRRQSAAILSPLRRIPPEVLGEIFSWILPSVPDALDRRKFDANVSPWVLTQISGRFRAVAVSTPSLWSLVVINCDHTHANPMAMIRTQIKRAERLQIHFFAAEDSRRQLEIFQCLAEHSPRWESLCIELTPAILPLLPSLQNRVSLLRRSAIQWQGPNSEAGAECIDCFQTAPSLLDICIYNQYNRSLRQFKGPSPSLYRGLLHPLFL
ncbi:hypothetical protein B0H17DRAFT_1010253 [Mycena rosella]|uniref:F-box domain-containing protein n=1 Tax=Mycena rosella TaxID=1033263 RepID=A0AAD7DK29_MYCRO|nr:hypothetical protein B0H17DRAFT_1010253 [Mycena rosella]